jgi:signal transduction histidine kinase
LTAAGYSAGMETKTQTHEQEHLCEDVLYSVAHDLRNPLGAIVGYAALLLEAQRSRGAAAGPSLETGLRYILACGRLADGILRDITDSAAMQRRTFKLERTVFEVVPALEDVLGIFRSRAHGMRVELALEAPTLARCVAVADRDRFQQVLCNLISNALKAVEPRRGVVRLRARAEGADLVVSVDDNGIGIEPCAQPLIFEKYFQVRPADAGGLGLGLFSARLIAEAHGGTLTVQSAGAGRGSSFVLRLPRALAAE